MVGELFDQAWEQLVLIGKAHQRRLFEPVIPVGIDDEETVFIQAERVEDGAIGLAHGVGMHHEADVFGVEQVGPQRFRQQQTRTPVEQPMVPDEIDRAADHDVAAGRGDRFALERVAPTLELVADRDAVCSGVGLIQEHAPRAEIDRHEQARQQDVRERRADEGIRHRLGSRPEPDRGRRLMACVGVAAVVREKRRGLAREDGHAPLIGPAAFRLKTQSLR